MTHDALVERIVAPCGVDRGRVAQAADLYLRQLRRGAVFAED